MVTGGAHILIMVPPLAFELLSSEERDLCSEVINIARNWPVFHDL